MTPITFTLTTKTFGPVVKRTITSLAKNLQRFGYRCNLLIIDKSVNANTLEWLNQEIDVVHAFNKVFKLNNQQILQIENDSMVYIWNAEIDFEQDSIQRSRIQMNLAISYFRDEIKDDTIWQLDDDMVFDYTENKKNFPDVIGQVISFRKNNPTVDAATGTGFYTPPIPILLYLEKNLIDLITSKPIPSRGLSTSPNYYHDLYEDLEFPTTFAKVERTKEEFEYLLQQILTGNPVFRPIQDGFFLPEKPWHRGGNFIIFNLEAAVTFPHLSVHYRGLTSRRSDMIHARLLHEAGFKISGIPMSLFHFRDQNLLPDFTKLKLEYLRDALGAIAVRFLDKEEVAFKRLGEHKAHIDRIIALVKHINESIESLISVELLKTLHEIRNELELWNKDDLIILFTRLKTTYYSLISNFKNEENSSINWTER